MMVVLQQSANVLIAYFIQKKGAYREKDRKIIKTETAFDSLHMIQHLSMFYRMQTITDSFHYQ